MGKPNKSTLLISAPTLEIEALKAYQHVNGFKSARAAVMSLVFDAIKNVGSERQYREHFSAAWADRDPDERKRLWAEFGNAPWYPQGANVLSSEDTYFPDGVSLPENSIEAFLIPKNTVAPVQQLLLQDNVDRGVSGLSAVGFYYRLRNARDGVVLSLPETLSVMLQVFYAADERSDFKELLEIYGDRRGSKKLRAFLEGVENGDESVGPYVASGSESSLVVMSYLGKAIIRIYAMKTGQKRSYIADRIAFAMLRNDPSVNAEAIESILNCLKKESAWIQNVEWKFISSSLSHLAKLKRGD